ncbi:MAG: tetratricopeptide repeat protein [Planctomycetota bacterium]|jgi:tetratricopeptide (TPR) repeat protein
MHRRWSCRTILALWILVLPAYGADGDRFLKQGEERLRKGLYKSALKRFRKATEAFEGDLKASPADGDLLSKRNRARWGTLRVLEATGQYKDCETALETILKEEKEAEKRLPLQVFQGDLYRTTGRAKEALALYDAVLKANEDNLGARLGKGYALEAMGKKEEAFKTFEWFVGFWAAHMGEKNGEILESVALACIEMGVQEQDLYLDAQKLLEKCEREFPERQDARVALAVLYIDRYTRAQSRPVLASLFKENPNHPRGRAIMALNHLGSFRNKKAMNECDRALKVNPNLRDALLVKASIQISDQAYDPAEELLKKALAVNPADVEVMSVLAGCRFMRGDAKEYAAYEKKVLALRPKYGRFYLTVGNMVSSRRRLTEAVQYYRKAVELDPLLWAGYFALGLNLSRQGKHKEAYGILEKGYEGDKYNVQVHNLLKLFDAYDEHFVTKETPHFHLLFHKSEFSIMEKYCGRLLEESWEALTKKYAFEPAKPVYSEMFSLHDDFAVRTMGFPGLGALGACFGPLITLDSPRARPPGAFNWASTTWHEFAHVITVQLSKGRVPRWFTEGLSVYEERCGRPNWVRPAHRKMLGRWKAGGLTPLKELNAQFTRGDVLLAYFHASWVVEFIVETYGFKVIIEMLKAYGRDLDDAAVAKEVLKGDLEGLDEQFKTWLSKRFEKVKVSPLFTDEERRKLRLEVEKNPGDVGLRIRFARACLQNGKMADAEIHAGRARKTDPSSGEASNILGEVFFLKKRFEAAEKYFHEALEHGVSDYNTWLRLASLAEKKGEVEKAVKFFEMARDNFPEYVGEGNPYKSLRVLYGRAEGAGNPGFAAGA